MMIGSQIYIEVKTLGINAYHCLTISDCGFMFNLILPPPPKINILLRRVEAGTLHGDMRHVVCLLRYVQSQVISNL